VDITKPGAHLHAVKTMFIGNWSLHLATKKEEP